MKILDRYIAVILLKTTGVAMLVLLSLFAVLLLIDQLGDVGHGNYDIIKVIEFVCLTLPRLAFELAPVAAIIGGMTTLGILAHNSELVIIHTSGVSRYRLALSLIKGGVLIVVVAILIGELLVPYSEHTAQQLRSVALSRQVTLNTGNGFWSRDGSSFINIRKILPGDQVQDIYIYEFDADDRLRTSTYARRGRYVNGQWILEDIEQSVIDNEKVIRKDLKLAAWDSLLNPGIINLVTIKPDYLTLWGLLKYIRYLKQNEQNSQRYEQALWSKLISPFTILTLIVLAVPLVRCRSRTVAVGQRVFMGCLAGLVFHVTNQISAQMGIVYSVNAMVSVILPTLVVASVTLWLLRREERPGHVIYSR
jgi:lipopolysaccharide export system permease protein